MVVTEDELDSLVAADRAAGKRIAFANGCFDILHAGHVRYVAGALTIGDTYVWNVRCLNGTQRGKASQYLFFQ